MRIEKKSAPGGVRVEIIPEHTTITLEKLNDVAKEYLPDVPASEVKVDATEMFLGRTHFILFIEP